MANLPPINHGPEHRAAQVAWENRRADMMLFKTTERTILNDYFIGNGDRAETVRRLRNLWRYSTEYLMMISMSTRANPWRNFWLILYAILKAVAWGIGRRVDCLALVRPVGLTAASEAVISLWLSEATSGPQQGVRWFGVVLAVLLAGLVGMGQQQSWHGVSILRLAPVQG